jgi:hypothetical protein
MLAIRRTTVLEQWFCIHGRTECWTLDVVQLEAHAHKIWSLALIERVTYR